MKVEYWSDDDQKFVQTDRDYEGVEIQMQDIPDEDESWGRPYMGEFYIDIETGLLVKGGDYIKTFEAWIKRVEG